MTSSPPDGAGPNSGSAEGFPSEFSVSYLHVGQTVHHELDSERLRWFLAGKGQPVHEHASRLLPLGDGVWLIAFRKGPDTAQISTYLVVDTVAGTVFDSSFLPGPKSDWRFDRGALGSRVKVGTPLTFPRVDVTLRSPDTRARGFAVRPGLLVVVVPAGGAPGSAASIEVVDLRGENEVTLFADTPWAG